MSDRITWTQSQPFNASAKEFIGSVGGISLFSIMYRTSEKTWMVESIIGDFDIEDDEQPTEEQSKATCESALERFVATIGAVFRDPADGKV